MASYTGKGAPSTGTIYISNLPEGTDDTMLAEYFGTFGLLKKDKRTGRPKIWLYHDKMTSPRHNPRAKITLCVTLWVIPMMLVGLRENAKDLNEGGGRGRGQGDASGKAWQQDGDWFSSHMQIAPYALLFKQLFQCNFAFRGVCNRCASARPSGPFGSGAGAVGHGRGRVANDSGVPGRCGNITGQSAQSAMFSTRVNLVTMRVLGGRGGGYKELEEELDETKRRRKEAEVRYSYGALDFEVRYSPDDGVLYMMSLAF
ncbi:hypothetical protein OIU79_004805 [Salix purpurea]|uniref:RRM domain-containing protein n=1 Tax=Salix purpurea TaxID=77065 RepID=A0A9Q0UB08_SALPP|nr:hypothetical protein OIU79_004805 [Salix purpurea]